MGKKKSKRTQTAKKTFLGKLDTVFPCPFCNGEQCCAVKMNQETNIGFVECRLCNESYESVITYLSAPLDVYNDWIDACDIANRA